MDRASALSRLTALTAGHITATVVGGSAVPALSRTLTAGELADLGPLLERTPAPGGPGAPTPQAVLRTLPTLALGNPVLTPAATRGMLPETEGPILDELGNPHWIDLFPPVVETAVSRAPGTIPFLVLPLALGSGPVPATVEIGAGSLWIEAGLLAPGSPAGGFAGLAISGGTLTASTAPTQTPGGGLAVAAGTTLTLTVTPSGSTGPVGGGDPGADGGAVVADLPGQVTFVLGPGGGGISAAGPAALTVYGTRVGLSWEGAAPIYEAVMGSIVVPLTPDRADFTPTTVLSTLLSVTGTAPIGLGGWSLPVAVTAPALLGTASTGGLLGLGLDRGLEISWAGVTGGPATLRSVFLAATGGVVSLLGSLGGPNRFGAVVDLWSDGPAPSTVRSSLELTFAEGELVYYTSVAALGPVDHVELLTCGAVVAAHIDRPVAADGGRLGPTLPGILAVFETATEQGVVVMGIAPKTTPPPSPMALALRNALLVTTPPELLLVRGRFSVTPAELDSGVLLLAFGLDTLLPTLPDPYAANFLPLRPMVSPRDPALGNAAVGAPGPGPGPPSVLLAAVRWTPSQARLAFLDLAGLRGRVLVDPLARRGATALMLLDVSSNIDQLGVAMDLVQTGRVIDTLAPPAAPGAGGLAIVGLDLVAPCLDLRVFTVPAVSWEPVVTVQNPLVAPDPFPSPAGFLDDGGPSVLGASDVTLVPVAPGPLLDRVLSAYAGGAAGEARFTLPFGMVATAALPASSAGPAGSRPRLVEVQPEFAGRDMAGGRQVSIRAGGSGGPGGVSPSLPGETVQLRNLVQGDGTPAMDPRPGGDQLSVLGPDVDTIFNGDFGPGGHQPLVPVSRYDLSGYGASAVSAWVDPTADPPAVVQATFNVLVGRTSREVVQVKSILYPWGAIVVRTITIDRQDDSEVHRYDSGWVAATPGVFATAGITVHPGAVTGAFNLREIADTSQTWTTGGPGGPVLVGVVFDADIRIEGVVSGARGGLVPSTGQLGFVQTAPVGTPVTPAELALLLDHEGPLGGPVDCVVSVGRTAQTMRVSRVEVGNAPHTGASPSQEFAATARGSVVLPQPGSWSVLSRTDDTGEPTPIDPQKGVALIRQGPAGTGSTEPWRLAEPVDLWVPASPSMDFCLLHATDSTRILFPRPVVEDGAAAVTSDVVPLLADGMALTAATSVCPRQDSLLGFPDASYSLDISGAGAFTLAGVPVPFPPTIPERSLATATAGTIAFEYADVNGNPAEVSVSITPDDWSIGVAGVNVRLDMGPFGGLMRTYGDLNGSKAGGIGYQNPNLVLGSVLSPLQDLMGFLKDLGLPIPMAMAFSNSGVMNSPKIKMNAGIQFSLPNDTLFPFLTPLLDTPLGKLEIAVKANVGNMASSYAALLGSSSQWIFGFTFSGSIQVAIIPSIPVKAGGMVAFGLQLAFPAGKLPQSETFSFEAGVIITIGGNLVPGVLQLEASIAFAFKLVIVVTGSTSVSMGVALIFTAKGMVLGGLIGITFTAEADGMITVTSPQAVQATFSVSVDICVCWFINIPFSTSVQYTKQLT